MVQYKSILRWSALLLMVINVSCRVQKNSEVAIIQLIEEKRASLNDSVARVSEIGAAVNVGSGLTILYSNKISLMVDSTVQAVITSAGEGPGQFIVCSAPCINGDTLFILDAIGGKILAFSIQKRSFLRDYRNIHLREFEAIHRYNGVFYGVKNYLRLALENKLKPETILLSSMTTFGDSLFIQDLPFQQKDARMTLVERLPAGNPFKMIISDDKKPHIFYFNLGLSKVLWEYNTQSQVFRALDIVLEQPTDQKIKNTVSKVQEEFAMVKEDPQGEVKKLIFSLETPMCSAVYGDTLIVVSKYFAKYDYNIRIYSISKNKLLAEGQMPLPSNLLSVEAVHILDMKHICLLEVAKNANSRYPYTIVTKKISITNPE